MREQLKYLIFDLDRWAFPKKIPISLIFIVLLIYPATWSILSYRINRGILLCNYRIIYLLLFIPLFIFKRIVEVLMSCEISEKADIGPGFYIAHSGAIIIGAGTKAGKNFSIRQGVTFGGGSDKVLSHPLCGDNVIVGAGAKVIGGLSIEDNVIIGANAVVTRDIPTNARVGGIPAKIINLKGIYGISIRPKWNY